MWNSQLPLKIWSKHTYTHAMQKDLRICPNVSSNIFTLQAAMGRKGLAACSLSSFTGCEVESEVSGVFFFFSPPFLFLYSFSFFSQQVCLYSGWVWALQGTLQELDKKLKARYIHPRVSCRNTASETVNRSHRECFLNLHVANDMEVLAGGKHKRFFAPKMYCEGTARNNICLPCFHAGILNWPLHYFPLKETKLIFNNS